MRATPTILIADDDLEDRISLRDMLEANGYSVIDASNGDEATLKCREHIPDLVILDVGMPPDDGYAVCERLRNEVRTAHIPVLMLTCHGQPEEKTKGLRSGADDYVVKPCNNDELLARMEALFRRFPPKNRFFERLEHAHQSILAAETFRRRIVVMSIDVRGSSLPTTSSREEYERTLMFRDYHNIVDRLVKDYEGQLPVWAGDGGTTEFVDDNSAVRCAFDILHELCSQPRVKTLIFRIGIAAGSELLEPTSEIGKRTSQTHNRAGHFQKHSNYNTITVGREVFDALVDNSAFKARTPVQDEIVYEANKLADKR